MDWRDEGALLTVRRHGESAAIIEIFTAEHGRHGGVVPGGASRRMAPVLQPGAQLSVEWRARLDAHIGTFRVEPLRSRAAAVLSDRRAPAAMASVAALLTAYLPEREPHPDLYAVTQSLLDLMGEDPSWPRAYALWEVALLAELGYALDLHACAVTGARDNLTHVSPKSGRAVSAGAAAPYADRLLPLPAFLSDPTAEEDLPGALRLTGHFLETWVAPVFHRAPPAARIRLPDAFR